MYYEMLFNDYPWNGRDEKDLLKNINIKPLNLAKHSLKIEGFSKLFLEKVNAALFKKDRL
jgi:hypothetical protein